MAVWLSICLSVFEFVCVFVCQLACLSVHCSVLLPLLMSCVRGTLHSPHCKQRSLDAPRSCARTHTNPYPLIILSLSCVSVCLASLTERAQLLKNVFKKSTVSLYRSDSMQQNLLRKCHTRTLVPVYACARTHTRPHTHAGSCKSQVLFLFRHPALYPVGVHTHSTQQNSTHTHSTPPNSTHTHTHTQYPAE